MNNDIEILTVGEAADAIGIDYFSLAYLIRSKKVFPPRRTAGGKRRYYLRTDIDEMRTKLCRGEQIPEMRDERSPD